MPPNHNVNACRKVNGEPFEVEKNNICVDRRNGVCVEGGGVGARLRGTRSIGDDRFVHPSTKDLAVYTPLEKTASSGRLDDSTTPSRSG